MLTVFVGILVLICGGCTESPPAPKPAAAAPSALPAGHPDMSTAMAPAKPSAEAVAAAEAAGPEVDLDVLHLSATDKWVRKPPRSGFVMAEFALPKAAGDEQDGRLTVSAAGGSIEDNIERWRKQFGAKPDQESKDEVELDGTKVTVVDFSGTYNDSMGPFAPGVDRAGYRMLGAIIPIKGQTYFVKAYGPEKTMAAHAEAFQAFLKTLKLK
jgi:hypothetical protein